MSDATKQLDKIFKKLEAAVLETVKPTEMRELGSFIADLIKKRTRLGYGVTKDYGQKEKLAPLSPAYKDFRSRYRDLSGYTSSTKSNLTLTGQMLDSYGVLKATNSLVSIGVKGQRNVKLLLIHEEGNRRKNLPQRVFNRLSRLEFQQAVRLYRRNFGDLLSRRRLIS